MWFAEQYMSYAICIVIILIITLAVSLYETKRVSMDREGGKDVRWKSQTLSKAACSAF